LTDGETQQMNVSEFVEIVEKSEWILHDTSTCKSLDFFMENVSELLMYVNFELG
jgi:hypothetical protein